MKTRIIFFISLLFFAVITSSFSLLYTSCNSVNSMVPPPNYDTYEQEWQKVDSLIKKGLPQSALEMVETIYDKSLLEDNHPQYIKATLYKIKFMSEFEEEFIEKIIEDLNLQISKAETPVKQILHSITADIYWRYYQANRYKFLDRTTAINIEKDDIRTWDLKTLLDEVIKNYQASLEGSDELKMTDLKAYDVILETSKESKKYRPTLYDFLAHRAVDFFMNEESSIIQPIFKFELDKEEYFAKALNFSKLKLENQDSLSLKFYAMEILQDLIRFHLNDEEPTAMVDVNLKRLEFIHLNSILPNKDSLYLDRLETLEKSILVYPSYSEVSYLIAKEFNNKGRKYDARIDGTDDFRWEVKRAAEKCQEAIQRFPESDGAQNCRVLLSQIEKPELKIESENVRVPGNPSLALLEFQNTSKVHFKLINVDYEQHQELTQDYRTSNEQLKKYSSLPVFTSWDVGLPNEGDYQKHATEIKIPELPLGFYFLIACNDSAFDVDTNYFASTTLWVSRIGFISQNATDGTIRYFMMDRTSGAPIEGVKAEVIFKNYNYQSRSYQYVKGESYFSDREGYCEVLPQDVNGRRSSFHIIFTKDNDKLVSGIRHFQSSYSPADEKKQTKTWFFTDRAIYRPGQTIYFKGIVIDKQENNFEIRKNFKTTVEFFDVNYQKISELNLVTNEYGSFNGTFTAPTGGLNGQMTIRNKTGSINITVEEYKRPQFEVVFNPVQGSYKLNEIVTITGNAKAYAGNNIDNASVNYRILRHTRRPYYRYWAYDFYPGQPMEIEHGSTQTNENGEFTIDFKAIPDYSVSPESKPVFFYRVFADITDMNGETQSASTEIGVGYTAMNVWLKLDETIEKDDLDELEITTSNWNGQPVPASGNVIIAKLKEPERLLREKKWNTPDINIISKEDYINAFPLDAFGNENRMDKLEEESVVAAIDFNTANDSIIKLPETLKWKTGRYSVKVRTEDSFGEKIEFSKYFTLFDREAKNPPVNEMNWYHSLKDSGEPGENAAFIVGTKDKNVRVLYEITHKDKTVSRQWLKLSNEQRKIEVPILEEYRGGFKINIVFIKHNRSFDNSFNVQVPFTNKELDFEFLTFRDKLIPGQQEEWSIKVKGKKGDLVAAELLASMYDASLDALKSNRWNFKLFDNISNHNSWYSWSTFGTNRSDFYMPQSRKHGQMIYRNYDQLNWFGFYYYGGGHYRRDFAEGDGVYEKQALPGQGHDIDATVHLADEDEIEAEEEQDNSIYSLTATTGGGILGKDEDFSGLQLRRDFRETAFFFPSLKTNEDGDVKISFTVPESLTKWKLMGLAHSQDLEYGMFEKEIVTQKDLMVIPNPPRFFREGDEMSFLR